MSRCYNMSVVITDVRPDRLDEIKAAAFAVWDFDSWHDWDGKLIASADGYLCGGETEPEFVERLAKVVWAANGGPCTVSVDATYLEDLLAESYSLDESDYGRLIIANKEPTDDG